jgi:hypothetical protein
MATMIDNSQRAGMHAFLDGVNAEQIAMAQPPIQATEDAIDILAQAVQGIVDSAPSAREALIPLRNLFDQEVSHLEAQHMVEAAPSARMAVDTWLAELDEHKTVYESLPEEAEEEGDLDIHRAISDIDLATHFSARDRLRLMVAATAKPETVEIDTPLASTESEIPSPRPQPAETARDSSVEQLSGQPTEIALFDDGTLNGPLPVLVTGRFFDEGKGIDVVSILGSDSTIAAEQIHAPKRLDGLTEPLWDQEELTRRTHPVEMKKLQEGMFVRAMDIMSEGETDLSTAVLRAREEFINTIMLSVDPRTYTGELDSEGEPTSIFLEPLFDDLFRLRDNFKALGMVLKDGEVYLPDLGDMK